MATLYRTRDGDCLDQICHRHYGRCDVVVAVIDANPHVSSYPPVFPEGVTIELPDIEEPTRSVKQLWD